MILPLSWMNKLKIKLMKNSFLYSVLQYGLLVHVNVLFTQLILIVIYTVWATYLIVKNCMSFKTKLRRHKNFFIITILFIIMHDMSNIFLFKTFQLYQLQLIVALKSRETFKMEALIFYSSCFVITFTYGSYSISILQVKRELWKKIN